MHTKDFLAAELRKAGLEAMAVKAENGIYHDYLSPLVDPPLELDRDLVKAAVAPNALAGAINLLRQRHWNGEFDASKDESDAWAKSFEGRRAMQMLVKP